MKNLILILLPFLVFISCKNESHNVDGTPKNYLSIEVDTNCINVGGTAFFELENKTYDTVCLLLKNKIQAVLGRTAFTNNDYRVMQDSIRKVMFNLDSLLLSKNIQIDTTNLLTVKDNLPFYPEYKSTPKQMDWRHIVTQENFIAIQILSDFQISYTIFPCVKKIISKDGKFKRVRKGTSIPDYAKSTNTLIDAVTIYKCLLYLSIQISIEEPGTFNSKSEFYKVLITDTANVYTITNVM